MQEAADLKGLFVGVALRGHGRLLQLRAALPQKALTTCVSALPPDLRRWLCPAVAIAFPLLGYAPRAAMAQ